MSHKLLGIDVARSTTTQEHELGMVVDDIRGGQGADSLSFVDVVDGATTTRRFYPDAKYMYVKAGSAISATNAVTVSTNVSTEPYSVVPTSAAAQRVTGIAETAIASGSYGWIKIKGRVNAALTSGGVVAAGDYLVTTSTAGALASGVADSNVTSSSNVLAAIAFAGGARPYALDSTDSNTASVEINLPY